MTDSVATVFLIEKRYFLGLSIKKIDDLIGSPSLMEFDTIACLIRACVSSSPISPSVVRTRGTGMLFLVPASEVLLMPFDSNGVVQVIGDSAPWAPS